MVKKGYNKGTKIRLYYIQGKTWGDNGNQVVDIPLGAKLRNHLSAGTEKRGGRGDKGIGEGV